MSFLDLYQGDQDQAARMQPNEGHDLPSGFDANFNAAWSNGLLFSQSVARDNARAGVLSDYVSEIRQKTGQDISQQLNPAAESGTIGPGMFEQANARVAKMKADYPDLDLNPLSEDEIDSRAIAKATASHRNYEALQAGEKTAGGSFGSFLGSAAAGAADPINIVGLPIAPEAAGIGILSTALRWGALAGVSQTAIEFASDGFKEQVQPGYTESGAPLQEIGGAFVGGAVVGGTVKALGNAWSRVKTGQWPTSVRDAGNVIESEANIASTNPLPGVEGEVAHREALVKTIDDILAGRPIDVSAQITPELQQAAVEAERGGPLIVARRMPDGTIRYGKPGQIHADLIDADHFDTHVAPPPTDSMGFSTPGGPFMSRDEATAFLDKNHPEISQNIDGIRDGAKRQIEAGQYNAALKQERPSGLTPEQLSLPLAPETEAMAPKRVSEPGPQPVLQTVDEMTNTLTAPDHQDAIRADIDRERAMGDVQVPGIDENGNHTMVSVDKAMDQVDAYKAAAEQIQACANPAPDEAEAA